MGKTLVAELNPRQAVDSTFAVRRKSLAPFRNKPGEYLNLLLADRTGEIAARVWDNAAQVSQGFEAGDVIRVQGQVDEYQGRLQLVVKVAQKCDPADVDPSDYVPAGKRDREVLLARVDELIAEVQDKHLRALLEGFFGDPTFGARFASAAGAKALHHSFIGGLLEHTVGVLEILLMVQRVHPELDRDLLITGTLLHDIGKAAELSVSTTIEYTDSGRLLGHTVLTDRMVRQKISQLPDFPEHTADLLMHMVLSHHGKKEFGAPIEPMTPEACALHYADNLDAHVQYFLQVVAEAEGSASRWSDYLRLFDRHIYLGSREPPFGSAQGDRASPRAPLSPVEGPPEAAES